MNIIDSTIRKPMYLMRTRTICSILLNVFITVYLFAQDVDTVSSGIIPLPQAVYSTVSDTLRQPEPSPEPAPPAIVAVPAPSTSAIKEVIQSTMGTSETRIEITIDDAVRLLLRNNPEINKALLEWKGSQDKLYGSYGTFEPTLVGNVKHETANRPVTLFGQIQNVYSGGIEGLLPSATKYEMHLSVTDLRYRFPDNTSLPYTLLNFTLTQPLLKGLWFGKPIIDVKAAHADREIALQKFRTALFSKIFELEIAYWKLCLAQEKYSYANHSMSIAQEIVDDSRHQLRTGKISQLDAVEASAALAERQNVLNDAQKDLISAVNDLKLLITCQGYLIDTLIHASSPVQLSLGDSVSQTPVNDTINFTSLQPDYLQKKAELAREQLSVDYQTDQCLPELNIKGSYGYLVTGRQSNLVWNNFLNNDYRQRSGIYTAEVEFRIPIGMNIRERKLLDAEKKNLRSAEINLYSIQMQIENYLFASRKRIDDLRINLKNAKIVIDFRTSLLAAEITKQKAGKSNYRKIFEIEEELTKSKQWEIENIIDFRSLTAQIARLSGTMLLDRGLEYTKNGSLILNEESIGKP